VSTCPEPGTGEYELEVDQDPGRASTCTSEYLYSSDVDCMSSGALAPSSSKKYASAMLKLATIGPDMSGSAMPVPPMVYFESFSLIRVLWILTGSVTMHLQNPPTFQQQRILTLLSETERI
jgi:hypothetical protein